MNREPGFYWVRYSGEWAVGYLGEDHWIVLFGFRGNAGTTAVNSFDDADIGPRIDPPPGAS